MRNEHHRDREYELLDKHLAGVLTPHEEAELEHLIRTSPDWARRYRETEDMARLVRAAIGRRSAPKQAKQAIRRRVQALSDGRAQRRLATRPTARTWVVAAAAVLAAVGTAWFLTRDGETPYIDIAYAAEPLPLKDLARSADVLLIGRTDRVDGRVRFHVDQEVFGRHEARACALPDSVTAGQRIAVFAKDTGDGILEVVGGSRGVIHLDGIQRWEGRSFTPQQVRRRLADAPGLRSARSALTDINRFLTDGGAEPSHDPAASPRHSPSVTARFLGRFSIDQIRGPMMQLVLARDKPPEARAAGAEALVAADPLGACRILLSKMLAGPVEHMHGETEDGFVILGCLRLIQAAGGPELAPDLRRFAARVPCPELKHAAEAAALAVVGAGSRVPSHVGGPEAHRVSIDGREGMLVPGCVAQEEHGLVVVFPGEASMDDLAALVTNGVGRGLGVIVMPPDDSDVGAWRRRGEPFGIGAHGDVRFVGVGRGIVDALHAARRQAPSRLVLVGPLDALPAHAEAVAVPTHLFTYDEAPANPLPGIEVHAVGTTAGFEGPQTAALLRHRTFVDHAVGE